MIDGAEILPNPNGTAVGQWVEHEGRVVVLLPGPPGELKPMMANECMPRLERLLPSQVIRSRVYRISGLTESDLDQLICSGVFQGQQSSHHIDPGPLRRHAGTFCGRAVTRRRRPEKLPAQIGDPIEELLGDRIYSRHGESLEELIGKVLTERERDFERGRKSDRRHGGGAHHFGARKLEVFQGWLSGIHRCNEECSIGRR